MATNLAAGLRKKLDSELSNHDQHSVPQSVYSTQNRAMKDENLYFDGTHEHPKEGEVVYPGPYSIDTAEEEELINSYMPQKKQPKMY